MLAREKSGDSQNLSSAAATWICRSGRSCFFTPAYPQRVVAFMATLTLHPGITTCRHPEQDRAWYGNSTSEARAH
jgi:hypothetical protein